MKLHRLAVVGGGNRGKHMAKITLREPKRAKIVAVVEKDKNRREQSQEEFEWYGKYSK